jgi:dihydroorotate dehydrogenase
LFTYENLKKFLFKLDPENAHNLAEFALKMSGNIPQVLTPFVERNFVIDDRLKQEIFGKEFINPVGLGAGFDKNGTMIKAMMALGFGYTEVGTVTPIAQPGNEKPRMFRYPEYESVQNAMGFNNGGSYELQKRVSELYPFSIPIGVNIGKNKTTPQNQALEDYKHLIKSFKDICDYLVINISSPNTPNLRDLQNEEFIKTLFGMSKELTDKPILLKIAPDMEADVALELCNTAIDSGASGIIATNTTIDYSLLDGCQNFGGLSGKVLQDKSYKLFKAIAKELYGKTMLISVGGIDSAEEAYKRIKAGATLVQVYSALIFHGPSLIKNINEGIIELLKEDGYNHISEAIGADLR